jgi:hypothetical protein
LFFHDFTFNVRGDSIGFQVHGRVDLIKKRIGNHEPAWLINFHRRDSEIDTKNGECQR